MARKAARVAQLKAQLLLQLAEQINSATLSHIQSTGLTLTEVAALFELHEIGTAKIGDLAKKTLLSLAATSQMIERLVKQGYLIRQEDLNDRRQKQVSLTETGKAFIQETQAISEKVIGQMLQNVPQTTLAKLEAVLEEVSGYI